MVRQNKSPNVPAPLLTDSLAELLAASHTPAQELMATVERFATKLLTLSLLKDGIPIPLPVSHVDPSHVRDVLGVLQWNSLVSAAHTKRDYARLALAALLFFFVRVSCPNDSAHVRHRPLQCRSSSTSSLYSGCARRLRYLAIIQRTASRNNPRHRTTFSSCWLFDTFMFSNEENL